MSSDADAAETVALFVSGYTGNYCNLAATVLFIHDALLTLDREVACFWTAKRTGASALLIVANKWIPLAYYVLNLVGLVSFPSAKMSVEAVYILQLIPGAVFSALRAYFLSGSKILGLLILALSLAPVATNLVLYGYQPLGEVIPPFGCIWADNTTIAFNTKSGTLQRPYDRTCTDFVQGVGPLLMLSPPTAHERNRYTVAIVSRVPLIVADMLLVYITWTKLSIRCALRNVRQTKRLSLSDILLCDGTLYFVILFILNALHLVFTFTAMEVEDSGTSYLTVFTGPLSSILISRFLLDLQEANQTVVRVDPDDPLHFSRNAWDDTPSFVSSLGAFINPNHLAFNDVLERDIESRSDGEEEHGALASESLALAPASSA